MRTILHLLLLQINTNRFMHKASEFEKETRTLLSDPNSMRSCLGKIEVEDQGGFQIIVI